MAISRKERSPARKGLRALLLFAAVFLSFSGCGKERAVDETPSIAGEVDPVLFTNLSADATFVGDDACFDCHEREYRGYQEHGMANSVFEMTPEASVESFENAVVYDSTLGFYYRMYEEGGHYFQEEYRLGPSGEKTHSQTREMQFVVGSGISARTYLTWEDGWLYQLPVTWYTQQRKWDLSPGYQISNKRFDRKILPRCLTCHDAYPTEVPFSDGKYSHIPLGISCERCHGPGSRHVENRLALPEADSIDYSIINPAHLSLEHRLDVCQQCHLNPTISVLRQGRTAYDFRPSQSLSEYLSLFEVETPETNEEIGLTSHVGRMKASACYRGSLAAGDPLECTTCHDPHSGFRSEGPEYFNVTCRTCHELETLRGQLPDRALANHEATSNCISCHMPKADIAKVAHSNFTDHWIRVVEQAKTPEPGPVHDPPSLLPLFDRDRDDPVYEGMAYVVYGTQQQDASYLEWGADLLSSGLEEGSDFGRAHFLLGLALTQLGRSAEAIAPLERAVTLDPDAPERLNALAQAYESEHRDPVRIERLYRRALAIQPARSDIRVNLGRFLESRDRLDEAGQAYLEAIAQEPRLMSAHYNYGTVLLRLGRTDEAESQLREAIELNPLDPEAWDNLGILYAQSERSAEALEAFKKAVEAAPENPVALGNLGTHYLQTDSLDEAIPLLARAVELAPDYLDGHVNLALAYFRNDEFQRARAQAERALEIDPDNALANQILGAI